MVTMACQVIPTLLRSWPTTYRIPHCHDQPKFLAPHTHILTSQHSIAYCILESSAWRCVSVEQINRVAGTVMIAFPHLFSPNDQYSGYCVPLIRLYPCMFSRYYETTKSRLIVSFKKWDKMYLYAMTMEAL